MAVSKNSRRAHASMKASGEITKSERIVLEAVTTHGRMTREQIAAKVGMKEGAVAGRVNNLCAKKFLVEVGTLMNPVTGKPNGIVDVSLLSA